MTFFNLFLCSADETNVKDIIANLNPDSLANAVEEMRRTAGAPETFRARMEEHDGACLTSYVTFLKNHNFCNGWGLTKMKLSLSGIDSENELLFSDVTLHAFFCSGQVEVRADLAEFVNDSWNSIKNKFCEGEMKTQLGVRWANYNTRQTG